MGISSRIACLIWLTKKGAFRRSELVSLDVEDLEFNRDGVTIKLRRSKSDQNGEGRKIGLPYGSNRVTCPVRALQDKRLSDKDVARIVKKQAEFVRLNPVIYAGHSLRAGFSTSAARAGKSERAIMKQTGQTSEKMVRRYIRERTLYTDNAAAGIGFDIRPSKASISEADKEYSENLKMWELKNELYKHL